MAELRRQNQVVRQRCAVVTARAVMVRTGEQSFGQQAVRSEVRGWIGGAGAFTALSGQGRSTNRERARRERECRMRSRCEWPSDREQATLGVAGSIVDVYEIGR